MKPAAQFTRRILEGIPVIAVQGEVDLSNVNEFKAFLEHSTDPDAAGIIVDLSRADYFDSRTIATLADFCERIRVSRQRVALVASDGGFAAKVLRVAGLPLIVPTFAAAEDAVAVVKRTS